MFKSFSQRKGIKSWNKINTDSEGRFQQLHKYKKNTYIKKNTIMNVKQNGFTIFNYGKGKNKIYKH